MSAGLERLARAAGETPSPIDIGFPLRFGLEAYMEPRAETVSAEESEQAVRDAQVWLEDIVRAILLALREPDEGMVEAGARKIYAPDDLDDLARQVAEEAFTAAIDSILNGDARP